MYRKSNLYRPNRRQFLKTMGASALGAAFLGACTAPGAAPTSGGEGGESVATITQNEYAQGNIPADLSASFKYTGWEGEAEMRKWLLHFDNFFGTNYPNVDVQGDWGVPWSDYWTKMPTQLAAGAEIDMMWMHDSRCKTFAANDWLAPLDDFIESFPPIGWPDEFYPSQVTAFQYEGKQYGIPYDFASGGLYCNLEIFEAAGIDLPTADTTWDEFLEIAKALTIVEDGETKQWGVVGLPTRWSGGAYWVTRTFGGDYWNEQITESRFNDEATIAAMQYLADLIWEHGVMPNDDMLAGMGLTGDMSILAFGSGLAAMAYSLNDGAFVFHEAVEGKFEWGFAPTPRGEEQLYFTGGSAFSIPSTSTQPELAYELIRYTLSSPDTLPVSGEMGSQFTGNMNFYEFGLPLDEWGVDKTAFETAFYELPRQFGVAPAYHPKYQEFEASIYQTFLDPLWVGEERDAAAACGQVHEALNQLLAS